MRYLALVTLAAASAYGQTVNTQVNGLVLTNRVFSLSDDSAVSSGVDRATGVGYLTDNDTSTFLFNAGLDTNFNPISGAAIEGYFNGPISASATGLYIISVATEGVSGGQFDVQLRLLTSFTGTVVLDDSSFTQLGQVVSTGSLYQNFLGVIEPIGENNFYAYAYVPYASFGLADGSEIVGVKLSNFGYAWPEIGYIGLGYAGGVVPEPSTYGLLLGGLALGCAAARRRKKA